MKISKYHLKSPRYCEGYKSTFQALPHMKRMQKKQLYKMKRNEIFPKTVTYCHLVATTSNVSMFP